MFCLPHQPKFSDIFDFHWVSVVRACWHDGKRDFYGKNTFFSFLLVQDQEEGYKNLNEIL